MFPLELGRKQNLRAIVAEEDGRDAGGSASVEGGEETGEQARQGWWGSYGVATRRGRGLCFFFVFPHHSRGMMLYVDGPRERLYDRTQRVRQRDGELEG